MRNTLLGCQASVDQVLVVGRRIEIADNLGGFLVLVVVVTSVLFDLLHWVNEFADVHAGRIGMLLQILTQLLQVVM